MPKYFIEELVELARGYKLTLTADDMLLTDASIVRRKAVGQGWPTALDVSPSDSAQAIGYFFCCVGVPMQIDATSATSGTASRTWKVSQQCRYIRPPINVVQDAAGREGGSDKYHFGDLTRYGECQLPHAGRRMLELGV